MSLTEFPVNVTVPFTRSTGSEHSAAEELKECEYNCYFCRFFIGGINIVWFYCMIFLTYDFSCCALISFVICAFAHMPKCVLHCLVHVAVLVLQTYSYKNYSC